MVLGAVHRIDHLRNLICVIGVGKLWVLSGILSHISPDKYNYITISFYLSFDYNCYHYH